MFEGVSTRSAAPANEVVSTPDMLRHLRETQTERSAAADDCQAAARGVLEDELEIALMQQTWTLKLDDFPGAWDTTGAGAFSRRRGSAILLPRPPLLSVTSIAYTDEDGVSQTVATTVYGVDVWSRPGRVYLKDDQDWPTDALDESLAVTIAYVAGYSASGTLATARAAVPPTLRHAIRLLAERLYDPGRDSYFGTSGHVLDDAVRRLIAPYRVMEAA